MPRTPWDFQLTEEHMRLLRQNDPAAEDIVLVWVYGYFDAFVRHLSQKFGTGLSLEECEDLVSEFFIKRFRPLVQAYSTCSAKVFSGAFVVSLDNFSRDYLRRVTTKIPLPDGTKGRVRKEVSIAEPVGADCKDCRTLEKTAPELQTETELSMKGLCGLNLASFREELDAYITKFCKGDALREWVLRAKCLEGMSDQEILGKIPKKFPGKNRTADFVYTLWYRFRHDAGLRRICMEYR